MMVKRAISRIIGVTQTIIGCLTMLFAFFVFYNIFDSQTFLSLPAGASGLYLWILIIFGLLSVMSGLFLFLSNER